MSRQSLTAVRSQAGFTLVELAVVMIIIGLLIGGVLKGQELVKNAQITATVAQVKGIDAATSSFRDMYNALPGDMLGATNRLPNCTGLCAPAAATADGNGQLSSAPNAAPGVDADAYFIQLAVADLLTGINTAATACTAWGQCFPEAKAGAGAGFQIGYWSGTGTLGSAAANSSPRGHYLAITTTADAAPTTTAGTGALTPNQAFRVDTKIDDGRPTTGSVVSGGANGTCVNGTAYRETLSSADCNLFLRIQG